MVVFCEEVQNAGTNNTIIPAHCLSFYEQSLYIAEFAQEEMNKLFESAGIEELAVFESTGCEIVYEGARFEELKKTVVSIFVKIWEAAKKMFANITYAFKMGQNKLDEGITKLHAKINEEVGNRAVKKTKELTPEILKALEGLKTTEGNPITFGKIHSYDKNLNDKIKKFSDGQESIRSKIDSEIDKIQIGEEDTKQVIEEKKEQIMKMIIPMISTIDNAENLEFAIGEIKKWRGEQIDVDAAWIKAHVNDINEITKNGYYLADIKLAYNKFKSDIDKVIKELKTSKEGEAELMMAKAKLYQKSITCYKSCVAAVMDINRSRFNDYRGILFAALFRGQKAINKAKADTDKDVKESTSVTTQEDLVNEAFNW